MATFEEANRVRLEGAAPLGEYGTVKDLTVARLDTSYVLLATFGGKYKKTPPEDLFIGSVRVVSVKEGVENPTREEGPKNPEHKDPAQQHLDEPKDIDKPRPAVPVEDKDKTQSKEVAPKK